MKDYPTLAIPLTTEERDTLTQYETYLEQHLKTFFEVGKILVTIRNQKLYREAHTTFEEYCRERWQISRPRAYQLIDAAEVKTNVSTICRQKQLPEPTNEAQARALKKVPAEKQAELWQKAIDDNNGKPPTGKQIIRVVETEFEKKPKDYRTVPTRKDMIRVVKAWLSLRFPKFDDALDELKEFCVPWMIQEPHSSILYDLIKHVEQLYIIDYKHFNVRDACKAVLKDWENLDPEELKHLDLKEESAPEEKEDECQADESRTMNKRETVTRRETACCSFCLERADKLYESAYEWSYICRSCAAKAQIELF